MANRTTMAAEANAAQGNSAPQEAIVDNDNLRRLYEIVLTCRARAETTADSATAGATAQAAATVELKGDDAVACTRDSMALELVRGASAEHGRPTLIERVGAGASQLSVAAGVALAKKFEGRRGVVVALTDAGSMSPGTAYDALNYASANKLPMIVVVENLGSRGAAPVPEFTTIARAHGVPGFVVDGDDAVAVYRVAREAINRARSGRGPSVIECRAFESAERPLHHLERYLAKHGLWTAEWKRELLANIEGEHEEGSA